MYFNKTEYINYFLLSEISGLKTKKKIRLTVKNRLTLHATGPSDINVGMYHKDSFNGIPSKFINATEDEGVSIINALNTLPSLKSDYFYIVGMLPEGWYNMTHMIYTIGSYNTYIRSYTYTYKENEISFYIKAGHINYIGDLYMADAHVTKVNFFGSNDAAFRMSIFCMPKRAQKFFNTHFPEIKLPFVTSLKINGKQCSEEMYITPVRRKE